MQSGMTQTNGSPEFLGRFNPVEELRQHLKGLNINKVMSESLNTTQVEEKIMLMPDSAFDPHKKS